MSFRRRLTLYGTAIAASTTLVLWAVIIILTLLGSRGDQRTTLEQSSLDAVNLWTFYSGSAIAPMPEPISIAELTLDGEMLLARVHPDGRVDQQRIDAEPIAFDQDTLSRAAESGHAFAMITVDDTPVQASVRPITEVSGAAFIAAMQSRLVADAAVEEIGAALVIASLVILIAAYRASSVVARRAITPLEQIATYSSEVTETGDTTRRLEVGRRGREIDDVVASFNTMVTQLGRSRDRTAAALESQRRFVADASHELRTPLTTIRTNAAFLRDHPDAAETDRDEALADIISESERMSLLTGELLDLARADADVLPLHLEAFDVGAVAERIARQATTPDRSVRAGGSARIRADRALITRLLWILVDNALVHGRGTVTIECDSTDASSVITVSDEGPGIPAADRHAVFERFHRVEGTKARGSGLGLALAKEIVTAHGGTISIDDSNGAVVLVRIPTG